MDFDTNSVDPQPQKSLVLKRESHQQPAQLSKVGVVCGLSEILASY